ncbi:MAG: hypothetical protein M5R38_00810 [Candidatus Methylomirabilis sp.]|nr:hypothetical protein [Candidatus Methylomirabilis sp.]
MRITGGTVNCTASGSGFGCIALGGGLGSGGLTLMNSTVSGNTVSCTASGGGFCEARGGGLRGGSMTLTNVTLSGNTVSCTASGGGFGCIAIGGGLDNVGIEGITTLTNVTLSGNTASCTASGGTLSCGADGAGLYNEGAVKLTNVTLSGNTTSCDGTGCAFSGALSSPGFISLQNTIIAKQLVGPDCSNSWALPPSFGHNLDSDNTCQLTQPSDHPGVTDPLLGPLQNNGGPTQTHALLPGSPAIDAGTISGCPSTDQRGITRPQGGTCDIGAFEFGVNVAGVLLNGSAFGTDQTITYEATLIPGSTPTQVDIYLGVLLPDGVTFLSFVPGPGDTIVFVFDTVPVPFAANVTLAPTDVPFAYTFNGAEPVGTYFTYAGLAVAGSDPLQAANQLSVGVQAFQFSQ